MAAVEITAQKNWSNIKITAVWLLSKDVTKIKNSFLQDSQLFCLPKTEYVLPFAPLELGHVGGATGVELMKSQAANILCAYFSHFTCVVCSFFGALQTRI